MVSPASSLLTGLEVVGPLVSSAVTFLGLVVVVSARGSLTRSGKYGSVDAVKDAHGRHHRRYWKALEGQSLIPRYDSYTCIYMSSRTS